MWSSLHCLVASNHQIYKHFNYCCLKALASTAFDGLHAVFFCLVSEDGDTLVSLLQQLNGRPVTDITLCCVAGWAAAVHWLCHLCETLTKISVLHGIQGRYCTTGTFVVVQHYVDWQLDLRDGCSHDSGCEAAVWVHSYSKTASLTTFFSTHTRVRLLVTRVGQFKSQLARLLSSNIMLTGSWTCLTAVHVTVAVKLLSGCTVTERQPV